MYIGQENSKILEQNFYAWMFLNLISFLHSSEGKDMEDLCSFGIMCFESHFEIFDLVDREVKTESAESCIDAKSSGLVSRIPPLVYSLKQTLKQS